MAPRILIELLAATKLLKEAMPFEATPAEGRSTLSPLWMAAVGFVLLLLLTACGPQSRLLKTQSLPDDEPSVVGGRSPDGLSVALLRVVVPDGPGSWVREAAWDEYHLALRNEGTAPMELLAIDVRSANEEIPVASHTLSREALAEATGDNSRTAARIGLVTGATFGAPMLITAVGGLSGYAALGVAVVALPIGVVWGGYYVYTRHKRDASDRILIDEELNARGLALPVFLGPQATVRASAFFPVTPSPVHLRIRYRQSGVEREHSLALTSLANPHQPQASR